MNETSFPEREYLELLARYPARRQGYGREPKFPGIKAQPMTYALVLMAEVRRFSTRPTEEGRRRIRSATRWLVQKDDLDGDGRPGWGLPDPYDAFNDGRGAAGRENPAHHPYTITTALALEGLADAMSLDVWSDRERAGADSTACRVLERWFRDVYTSSADGAFFWYSPFSGDAENCPNVSAMMIGASQRWLQRPLSITDPDRLRQRLDGAADALARSPRWNHGRPSWSYIQTPDGGRPNDALHHAYILWGMEEYRRSGGSVALPWTTSQAVESLEPFQRDGRLCELPANPPSSSGSAPAAPMRLWGAGMTLAVAARYGRRSAANRLYRAIREAYGAPSTASLHPPPDSTPFYHRHGAHLLLGLAHLGFPRRADSA